MASPVMHTPVLVLNATYEPIHITAVKRAIVLVLKGVARTEETNHAVVHAPSLSLPLPSVLRPLQYPAIPAPTPCQFCAPVSPAGELPLDHVLPRSRGGSTSWDNLVASCHRCNIKGDR